jgi:hypothetical protein
MPYSDLAHMPMADYAASLAQSQDLWIFLHIPKTAGTSITEELATHMAPYRNIFVDYEDVDTPFVDRLTDVVDRFIDELRHTEYRSCSGHLTYDLVARIRMAQPGAKVVTFLRNPVDRVISDYRYQCSSLHPGHDLFHERFPTLDSYVESPESQNKMALMLTGTGLPPSAEALIQHVEREFAFVGLVEMYALSFSVMMTAFGHPGAEPRSHARKTPDTPETQVEVSPELRARISALNALDSALYDRVLATLQAQREGWWAAKQG